MQTALATRTRTIRCSSLDRIAACPPSAQPPEVAIDAAGPEAEFGKTGHSLMQLAIPAGITSGNVAEFVPPSPNKPYDEELVRLASYGLSWLEEYGEQCGGIVGIEERAEVEVLPGLWLTGRMDLRHANTMPTPSIVTVDDWKFGWKSDLGNAKKQMLAYARLALKLAPTAQKARTHVVWLRDRSFDTYTWTRQEAFAEVRAIFSNLDDPTFRPGEHCRYCPRILECPAHREVEKMMFRTLLDYSEPALPVAEADLVRGYQTLQQWDALAKGFRDGLRQRVHAAGECVGETHKLVLRETQRDDIDPLAAWPVLEEWLTDGQLPGVVKIQKGKVEKAVKELAKHGEKQSRWGKMYAALKGAGAIRRYPVKSLALVKHAPELEQKEEEDVICPS